MIREALRRRLRIFARHADCCIRFLLARRARAMCIKTALLALTIGQTGLGHRSRPRPNVPDYDLRQNSRAGRRFLRETIAASLRASPPLSPQHPACGKSLRWHRLFLARRGLVRRRRFSFTSRQAVRLCQSHREARNAQRAQCWPFTPAPNS